MFDNKKRIYIIVGISIVVIAIVGLVYWYLSARNTDDILSDVDLNDIPLEVERVDLVADTVEEKALLGGATIVEVEPAEIYVKQLAIMFVERLNSYSNQNNDSHLDTVKLLVTEEMVDWLDLQSHEFSDSYSGVTTKVVASSVSNFNNNVATVLVDVQQVFETENSENIEQRSGRVELTKQNSDWKVSGFYWE